MLAEIREDEAHGATAAIYADIRETLGAPVVNLIWRHLATMDGALPQCWGVVAGALPRIRAALPAARALAAELVARHELVLPAAPLPALQTQPVADTIESYNRGNGWNLLSMTLLAAVRAGHAPAGTPGPVAPETLPPIHPPPYPRVAELPRAALDCIGRLERAGPASDSGVRPSLWVHLGLWPDLLAAVTPPVTHVLASPGFAAAHTELLAAVPGLLGTDIPPPARQAPAGETPPDLAIRRFRLRIAEMVLVGRLVRPA